MSPALTNDVRLRLQLEKDIPILVLSPEELVLLLFRGADVAGNLLQYGQLDVGMLIPNVNEMKTKKMWEDLQPHVTRRYYYQPKWFSGPLYSPTGYWALKLDLRTRREERDEWMEIEEDGTARWKTPSSRRRWRRRLQATRVQGQ